MEFLIIITFFSVLSVSYKPCVAAESQDLAPWLNELSEQNQATLVNVSDSSYNETLGKDYYQFDPKKIMRRQDNRDLTERSQDMVYQMLYVNPSNDKIDKACYTIQITWRRAYRDLTRYVHLRDFYDNKHFFEVGYLAHVIISKYMSLLEIYEMVDYRYSQHPTKNYAPLSWVWYMYTNALVYSKSIMHYCNMMHEIKKKYGVENGATEAAEDYETVTTPEPAEMDVELFLKNLHKNYENELKAKKKKKIEVRLHYKYGMQKPSMNLTSPKTKRPPQFWKWRTGTLGAGVDYGWSRERFFD